MSIPILFLCPNRWTFLRWIRCNQKCKTKIAKLWSWRRIELRTSSTLKTNHTPRPPGLRAGNRSHSIIIYITEPSTYTIYQQKCGTLGSAMLGTLQIHHLPERLILAAKHVIFDCNLAFDVKLMMEFEPSYILLLA